MQNEKKVSDIGSPPEKSNKKIPKKNKVSKQAKKPHKKINPSGRLAIIAIVFFIGISCVALVYFMNKSDGPEDVFADFVATIKEDNINTAADKLCSNPELMYLDISSFQYELFELTKDKIAYSFVSQSLVDQGQSAIVSINLSVFDLTSFIYDINVYLNEDEGYKALKEEQERSEYRNTVIKATLSSTDKQYIIINTVRVGFSEINDEWKIIVDDALIKALLGVTD